MNHAKKKRSRTGDELMVTNWRRVTRLAIGLSGWPAEEIER
jgi:hypothetical protein